MYGYGLIGLLILILDIYVIYLVLTGSGDAGIKLLWVILVLFLPLLGPILFFLLGPRSRQGLILELRGPLADTARLDF